MAKKKTSTSKSSPAAKAKGGRADSSKKAPAKTSSKKTTPNKKTTKKASTSKPSATAAKAPSKKTSKKTTKKTASKPTTKKTTIKAPAKQTDAAHVKKTTKKVTKKTSKKVEPKKTPAKPAPTIKKKASSNKPASTKAASSSKPKKAAPPPPPPPPPPPANAKGKDAPSRPSRPKRPKPPAAVMPEGIGGLLSPGGPAPKPLISSSDRREAEAQAEAEKYPTKSPFGKRELDKFRQTLLAKRAQVLAEVAGLEGDALTGGGSGNLSHTPQHMADAGSDAADQTLSLDLAAAERNLIREIDAALKRIEDGVFGLCVATGKPISKERLAELPWARFSIDAARQFEGRR